MGRDHELSRPALAAAAAIEAELRRLGWWSATPPAAEALLDPGPFGQHSLSGAQWLQFVLLERVREAAAGRSTFPRASNVATWAFREFDGELGARQLLHLLHDFDRLFEPDLLAAAAAWHPLRDAVGTEPALPAEDALFALPEPEDAPAVAEQLAEITFILDAEADIDARHAASGLTPLLLAIAFGCDAAEHLLLQRGADATLTDRNGRNAADWRILRLQARLRRIFPTLGGVRSARLAQLYFPDSRRFSTALVALELDGALPPDAFAALPATDPAVLMPLGGDAISRLAQLEPPFWQRFP